MIGAQRSGVATVAGLVVAALSVAAAPPAQPSVTPG